MPVVRTSVLLVVLAIALGCTSGGRSPALLSAVAPVASANSPPAGAPVLATPLPAPAVVPLILVHGTSSKPEDFQTWLERLAPGRTIVPALYAAEADALAPSSLSPNSVFAFGYYQESATGPVTSDSSIGACPVPRTDGFLASYPTAECFADRLRRAVAGVQRATGSPQVDLVLHSMGGLVGRSYTRWLSVGPNGRTPVRRIFLIASPSRGVNALEAEVTAFSYIGGESYRRLGECLELCNEATCWNGRAFVSWLDDDWDGFCAAHGIVYAGISQLCAHGPAAGLNPTASGGIPPPPATSLAGGGYLTGFSWALQSFYAAIPTFTWSDLQELPLLPIVVGNPVTETSTALEPGDGIVRFSSSRLDQAPLGQAALFGEFEGAHMNLPDPERGFSSSYNIECVRAFCLASQVPQKALCSSLALSLVRAPGRATWLTATIDVTGDSGLAAQLVEEPLDANGSPLYAIGYGAPLRPGTQTIAFPVVAGGGSRHYRLVVYGPSGKIGVFDGLDATMDDGALESAPLANVALGAATPCAGGATVTLALSSNAAGDPTQAFRMRVDHGAWSDWFAATSVALSLAPGIHRVEVVARSSSNAAQVLAEQGTPTGVGVEIDVAGNVTLLP